MKRHTAYLVTLLVAGISLVAGASPTVQVNDSAYQVGQGGELNIVILSDLTDPISGKTLPAGSAFPSFCVEKNEGVSLGGSYVGFINDRAVNGGVNITTVPGFDPLDVRTAWLYDRFIKQTLTGYDFSSVASRRSSAEALQHAIWFLEEEETGAEINALSDATAVWSFVDAANTSGANTLGDIRVLNLYTQSDTGALSNAQDVLCTLTPPVPAPAAVFLVGLGTAVVGLVRRRQTQS